MKMARFKQILLIALILGGCSSPGKQLQQSIENPNEVSEKEYPAEIYPQVGHAEWVNQVSVSPDGRFIASASLDTTVKLWDTLSGRLIKTFIGHTRSVTTVAFSPDGKHLASGSQDKSVKIWDIESGGVLVTYEGHKGDVESIAFSPDGLFLASGSDDRTIRIWDIKKGVEIKKIDSEFLNKSIVFSPDGKYVLDDFYHLWNIWPEKNEYKKRFWELPDTFGRKSHAQLIEIFPDGSSGGSISSDGNLLASTNTKGTVTIWDLSERIRIEKREDLLIANFEGEKSDIKSVQFSPDNRLLMSVPSYSDDDRRIRIWDVKSRKEIKALGLPEDGILSAVFTPDGRSIVSGNEDGTLTLWNIDTGEKVRNFTGMNNNIYSASMSADKGILLTASYSGDISFIDLKNGKVLSRQDVLFLDKKSALRGDANFPIISGDGKTVIAIGRDKQLWVLDAAGGQIIKKWTLSKEKKSIPFSLSFDGNHCLYLSQDKIYLINLKTGKNILLGDFNFSRGGTIGLAINGVLSVKFSEDNKRLLFFDRQNITIYDLSKYKIVSSFNIEADIEKSDNSNPMDLNISKALRFGISSDLSMIVYNLESSNDIYVYDVNKKQITKTLKGHKGTPFSITFSQDGKSIISGGDDGLVIFWDIKSGQAEHTFNGGNSSWIKFAKTSPDSRFIASIDSEGMLKLWNTETGAKLTQLRIETKYFEFSSNSKLFTTLSVDGVVRLFETASGKEISSTMMSANSEWVSVTPDGFFTGSKDGGQFLNVRNGLKAQSIDQFYDELYRPDIVQARINWDNHPSLQSLAETKPRLSLDDLSRQSAPKVEILSPNSGQASERDVEISIALYDQGGGIGRLLWKINGVNIDIQEPGRGLKRTGSSRNTSTTKQPDLTLNKTLTLSPGENIIEVVAYDQGNSVTSSPISLKLHLRDDISERPDLHILAVGINRYRDKSLWLNYAVSDVEELTKQLKASALGVFGTVKVTQVIDQNASLVGLETAFKQVAQSARTNDVFVLYLAGHGLTLDGRYHFLPVDFRYRNEDSVRENAINQDHLQKWLSLVQARKSMILLDTCNSGSYVEAQAVSRGLAEKTAIDKLIRATGRATISASSDSQVALEGIDNHGVFTYALLKALKEADKSYGNSDGVISTSELAGYIDEQVPELTYKKWGYEQVPQVNLHGRAFPIGITVE